MQLILEIILLSVTYLGFLYEPGASRRKHRKRRFNWLQYKADIGSSDEMVAEKEKRPLMEALNEEISQFYELYRRPLIDSHDHEVSIDEQRCSKLLFCFAQLYPELPALYLLTESILESADIMIERADNKAAADQGEINKLHRYSLALMWVAYLQSTDSATKSSKIILGADEMDASGCPLARYFVGFLAAYAQPLIGFGGQRVYIGPKMSSKLAGALEFKILIDQLAGDDLRLILLDPQASNQPEPNGFGTDDEQERRLIDEHRLDARLVGRLNLGRELGSGAREIGNLFGKILDHMSNICSSKQECSGLIASIFAVCSVAENDEATQADYDPLAAKESEPDDRDRIASIGSTWRRLNGRKILTNLLYLALFLLIRSLLLNYLESLRRDLKDKARDDMVQLKHTILSGVAVEEDPIYNEGAADEGDDAAYPELQVEDDHLAGQSSESSLEGDRSAGQPEGDVFAEISRLLVMKALGEAGGMNMADLMGALKESVDDGGDGELDEEQLENLLRMLMGGPESTLSQDEDDGGNDDNDADPVGGEDQARHQTRHPLEADEQWEPDGAREEL